MDNDEILTRTVIQYLEERGNPRKLVYGDFKQLVGHVNDSIQRSDHRPAMPGRAREKTETILNELGYFQNPFWHHYYIC